jgi:hypothetical protein
MGAIWPAPRRSWSSLQFAALAVSISFVVIQHSDASHRGGASAFRRRYRADVQRYERDHNRCHRNGTAGLVNNITRGRIIVL